jgi:hypothetical protein
MWVPLFKANTSQSDASLKEAVGGGGGGAWWSLHSHHVSLVQWTTRLLPVTRDPGSNPLGKLMWNQDFPVSVVSLHWWPRRDWSSLQPCLRRASSQTVTRPSCRQCDNPTWSHTALLSRFHACCKSPFWLYNRWSRLLGGSPVESLQSHFILTMSHWSSGLPVCLPSQGTRVQIPWGDWWETWVLLLALSRYKFYFAALSKALSLTVTHIANIV